MKKLAVIIGTWYNKLDGRWRGLSIKKQRRFILFLFGGYLLLTVGLMLQVWYDVGSTGKEMSVSHIENPVLQKKQPGPSAGDSVSTTLKMKMYE